jgi:hypothetical protein
MGSDGSHRDEGAAREGDAHGTGTGFVARLLANMSLGLELQRAHRTQLHNV